MNLGVKCKYAVIVSFKLLFTHKFLIFNRQPPPGQITASISLSNEDLPVDTCVNAMSLPASIDDFEDDNSGVVDNGI